MTQATWAKLRAGFLGDTRLFEFFLSAASIGVAQSFWMGPDTFSRAGSFEFMRALGPTEQEWAWLFFMTAALKLGGLGLLFHERAPQCSYTLRRVGSFCSALIWAAMGSSYLLFNGDSPAARPLILMALLAFWILVRGPSRRTGAP